MDTSKNYNLVGSEEQGDWFQIHNYGKLEDGFGFPHIHKPQLNTNGTYTSYKRVVSNTTAADIDYADELLRTGKMTFRKKRKKVMCVSECIICKGENISLIKKGFHIKEIDDFLSRGIFWISSNNNQVWTFDFLGKEIDTIITEAQSQIQEGILYEETLIYKVLNILIDNHISFAMWYDIYIDDLDVCKSKKEVLETCYNQIMDLSGMCEVYIVYNSSNGLNNGKYHK